MSFVKNSQSFLQSFYRIKPLRIFVIFISLLFLLYVVLAYTLVPFFLTKTIKAEYYQATGHHLTGSKITFDPFSFTLTLRQLKDSANLWQAESVFVDLALLQSIRQVMVVIDDISIRQLIANPQQLENGLWNFDDVIKHQNAKNINLSKSKTSANSSSAPILIKKIAITNSAINSNVLMLNNLTLAMSPLNITLTNIDFRGKSFAALSLSASINKTIPLEIKGKVDLSVLKAEVDVSVSSVPFSVFNSLLKPYVALEILNGFVETKSHIVVDEGALKTIASSGKVSDIKMRPTRVEQDVVKWKVLAWNDATIDFNQKIAKIPLVSLEEFDSQFIIYKDRTSNVQAMLLKPAPTESTVVNTADLSANATLERPEMPWKFSVDRIAIHNAAIGFNDQSLTPSFLVIVQQFSGDITDVTNDEQHTAHINLVGNVDGTAPVKLSGEAKAFIEKPQLDVLFSFQKMDMGALTPYSAEYAGWRIKKGLLSVDLHYRYEQEKIIGQNHVVIDNLAFGEKVRSPRLIDLPLRLGLALLTDENGIAVLDAEISGDPQNPSFNVGAVLMRVLRNTFVKIITSPFRFLSGLIHTDEDLGRIEFVSGDSQLNEKAINKLTLLRDALKKRPAMNLSIKGVYDAEMDVNALKEEQVKSALQKQGVTLGDINVRNVVWEQAVVTFYQSQALTNPSLVNQGADAAKKFSELVALQEVHQERLNTLAHERALAVKQYLVLQLGVASDKLFLVSEAGCSAAKKCAESAVVFALEH